MDKENTSNEREKKGKNKINFSRRKRNKSKQSKVKKLIKLSKSRKKSNSKAQKKAARKNIKKAQAKWKSMSHREHALAQPQGRARAKPGTKGTGKFYRITVRPKSEFVSFRVHDVGKKGHLERVAGRRKNGRWDTQAWLISKKDAHVKKGILVGNTKHAKQVLSKLQTKPKHVKGNIFEAKPRKDIPEKEKPTPAMKKAQSKNIKKAQAAR